MSVSRRSPRFVARLTAPVLGVAVFVMLMGLDERRATEAVAGLGTLTTALTQKVGRLFRGDAPEDMVWSIPQGRHTPMDRALTGAVVFSGGEIRLENGEAWKTAPHRIAYGREALARPLGLKDDAQIELRRILGEPAPTALCQGARPGYVGLTQTRGELTLILFPAGPVPDRAGPGADPCGWWRYRKP